MSTNRRKIPWRVVAFGLGLQLTLAGLILGTGVGHSVLETLNIFVLNPSRLAVRAMLGGVLASLMAATVAGIFIQ